jgi:nucleotide-binding universal stress UspA family protein
MTTLLVAIDGSEHSRRAVQYAARRARGGACRIELLHVEAPVMAWEVGSVSSSSTVAMNRYTESRALLEAGEHEFDRGVAVTRHAIEGDPAKVILEQAAKLEADEIVIGSRGLRPLGAAVLGSVTYKVLHNASIPVIVVH